MKHKISYKLRYNILEATGSREAFQFRRPCHPYLFSRTTRRSTKKQLIPARVGRDGPYHLEGSPCFPFLPGLCPEATKQIAFRHRKCSLACAGAPCTDSPFICLQSILLSGLKNPWRYFIRLNREARAAHSNLTEGRKQMMCTFLQGHMCSA